MTIVNPAFMLELEKRLNKNSAKSIDEISKYSKLLLYNQKELAGEVEIKGFPNLQELDLEWNEIEKLVLDDVSRVNLKVLKLGGNNFRNLEDCLSNVDVSKLTYLTLNDNYLTNLELKKFECFTLEQLDLGNRGDNNRRFKNYIAEKNVPFLDQLKSKIKILNLDNTDVKYNDDLNDLDYSESKEKLNINNNWMKNNIFFDKIYSYFLIAISTFFILLASWWKNLTIFLIFLFIIYKAIFSKVIRRKFTVRPILDTVKEVIPSKIYDIKSPRYNEEFWTIRCFNNTFRVYQDVIKDKRFLNSISNGSILGRQYIFIIKKGIRGNQIVSAEEFY